ncbi:putative membrane protein [Saonia flava]|uniref:Putative membrane protein n=1 Tax=Saonia flava TaxID=523696 RepID=A0A846QVW9_9FLAO|nr:DUF1772 domain-containing protein [Saonia flava]NJB72138.1 putative membrane protein [Saonia flava]
MTTQIIRFSNILMAALVAGTIFGIWIGYNPMDLSAATYIEQQQNIIIALNDIMPILGLITIILTLASAFLRRKEKMAFILLLVASAFLIFSGLITKFGNQPINSIVMTWDLKSLPNNWMELRSKWWFYHEIRTLTAFIGLCLIVWTSMKKD